MWVFQCLKNRTGGTQLQRFAVLEAGPSAPGLWHCHRPAPLLNAQHKGQGPEQAKCFSSSLPVLHASLQSSTPSPPTSRHEWCHTGRKHTLQLAKTQINHLTPADRLLSAQAPAHHSWKEDSPICTRYSVEMGPPQAPLWAQQNRLLWVTLAGSAGSSSLHNNTYD